MDKPLSGGPADSSDAAQLQALGLVAQALSARDMPASHRQSLERALSVVRDIFKLDFAISLYQADAVTAMALASSPPGALADDITHTAVFGNALGQAQPVYQSTTAANPDIPQRLRGATAILPWQGGSMRGATVLVRRSGMAFSSQEQRSIAALAMLLQLPALLTHAQDLAAMRDARFDAIVQSIPPAVIYLDALGIDNWINQRAAALLGLPSGAVESEPLAVAMTSLWSRAQAPDTLRATMAALVAENAGSLKNMVIHLLGAPEVYLSVSSTPVNTRRTHGWVWVFDDVTAQHIAHLKIEQTNIALLQAKAIAEQANAAKDMFLATMSHEIRNPMNGLLGMLELLELTPLNPEQRESLEIARDSGRTMGRIIDDILDSAKIAAGKLDIVPAPVSLVQLVQRIVNTHSAVARSKGLPLTHLTDPRIAPLLMADSLRLMQVLGNFVSNAIKFTHEGYVELRCDLLAHEVGAERICLSVRDTGIGLSAQEQSRLFQPFEQASQDTAHRYGGTGLGLSICQRLTELMGGAISVQSAPGQGTTMRATFTFPVAPTVSAASAG